MKTISLTQPWATLIAIGAKKIETRSWQTAYRGPLAIHAAKGFPAWARDVCWDASFCEVLEPAGYRGWQTLPRGVILATCQLVECVSTNVPDLGAVLHYRGTGFGERDFGDYSRDRFMWILKDVKALPKPIPAKGALGLWNWDASTLEVSA